MPVMGLLPPFERWIDKANHENGEEDDDDNPDVITCDGRDRIVQTMKCVMMMTEAESERSWMMKIIKLMIT